MRLPGLVRVLILARVLLLVLARVWAPAPVLYVYGHACVLRVLLLVAPVLYVHWHACALRVLPLVLAWVRAPAPVLYIHWHACALPF